MGPRGLSLDRGILVLAAVGMLFACRQSDPSIRRIHGALEGDAAPDGAPPSCGEVPFQGCCDGQTLWWCDEGVLKSTSCADRPLCGWTGSGYYDCNTSGLSDPSGSFALSCAGLMGDGGLPATDWGIDGGDDPCDGIGREGCCDGDRLKFCDEGRLKVLSCEMNPSCGWFAMGEYYDCGMKGEEDPTGEFSKICPGSHASDARPDGPAKDGTPPVDFSLADGGVKPDNGGCSCDIGGPASSELPWQVVLLAILWLAGRCQARPRQ